MIKEGGVVYKEVVFFGWGVLWVGGGRWGGGGGGGRENIHRDPDTLLMALYSIIISTHVRLSF